MTGFSHKIGPLVVLFALIGNTWADVDFSGEWSSLYHEDFVDRLPGPELGDYAGLPINDAARRRAETWDGTMWSVPEHQCKSHPSTYIMRGPADMRVWRDIDLTEQKVTAIHMVIEWLTPTRTIYLDGREHPSPNARHTWQGFSTGKWENDALVVKTTHIKAGYLRKNGIPHSDQATMIEYFRRFGDYLTLVSIVYDPVYLTEPVIKSTNWVFRPPNQIKAMSCRPAVELNEPHGWFPHRLPGVSKDTMEFAHKFGISMDAASGGAHTIYPMNMEDVTRVESR